MKYKVSFNTGNMTIIEAHNEQQARKMVRDEWGRHLDPKVVHATDEDLDWYEMMGGRQC